MIALEIDSNGLVVPAAKKVFSEAQLILIAGPTCSGKSTLARTLALELNGLILSGDNWALPEHEIIAKLGYLDLEHPDAYDLADLICCVQSLLEHGYCTVPIFDFSADCVLTRVDLCATANKVIVVEFIHALSQPILTALFKFKPVTIFVDANICLRLLRRIERDIRLRGKTLERSLMECSRIHQSMLGYEAYEGVAQYVVNNNGTDTEWESLIRNFRSCSLVDITSSSARQMLTILEDCILIHA